MKTIGIVCTARASWAKLYPVVRALVAQRQSPILYFCGSAILERFGNVARVAKQEFPQLLIRDLYSEVDGYNLITSGKSTALLLIGLSDYLALDDPRVVVVNHDRREVLAVAQAAAYQNRIVAHIGSGERTGSIDDRTRDAITALSTYQFPATALSTGRTYALTGQLDRILQTGCPSLDLAQEALHEPPVGIEEISGSGAVVNPHEPFVLVIQHADTNEWQDTFDQMTSTLRAVTSLGMPCLVQYSNVDAGAERLHKAVRVFKDQHPKALLRTIPNLKPNRFLRLLSQASALMGNSSAGIREASFLGTPVVNVGNRQYGRERAGNVIDVGYDMIAIAGALAKQLQHGRYRSSSLYGDGAAGPRIAQKLREIVNE